MFVSFRIDVPQALVDRASREALATGKGGGNAEHNVQWLLCRYLAELAGEGVNEPDPNVVSRESREPGREPREPERRRRPIRRRPVR